MFQIEKRNKGQNNLFVCLFSRKPSVAEGILLIIESISLNGRDLTTTSVGCVTTNVLNPTT